MNASPSLLENLPLLLEVDHFARILGFHPESVRRLIRRGRIKAKRFGSFWRIPRAEAVRIIENGI